MQQGIYHVSFSTSATAFGEGLAVFKGGTVNGGDQGYLYLGTFQNAGEKIVAILKVKRWMPGHVSVFGNLAEFELQLTGSFSTDFSAFNVTGTSPQIPGVSISIRGRKLSDAV